MTDDVANLVLDHLRVIRADIAAIKDDIRVMKVEMIALRQQMAAVMTIQDLHHGEIAAIKSRLDRIERRLELVE